MISLEVTDVKKSFFRKPVLDGVSFEIKERDAVSLAGANGSGKTTLLKILSGITSKDSGEIHNPFQKLLYLGHAPGVYAGLSPIENMRLKCNLYGQSSDEHLLVETLSDVGLENHKKKPCRVLSQGMLQRLKFATASLIRWDILLFDEPFAALDEDGKSLAESFFRSWNESGKTLLFTDHDSERSLDLASRQLAIEDGGLKERELS
ncbi:MAG: ATP-binding cassette domain-containing protein [Candidatus Marinimicrobia bacterium]|jgi:heme exporter protein A|nr:ATP-binding cassette domain-containing protein [Candidatus Neomarinimicrobiota bacterium]MDP6788976.1 ATP-binding cassette domain-containing protein [Candidatus Neomarinimicrobiota bacterium]MDP7072883.1 ATP-binding cassette domain-containing protein [Candidatus Neomarinimicrobiota bacterium]